MFATYSYILGTPGISVGTQATHVRTYVYGATFSLSFFFFPVRFLTTLLFDCAVSILSAYLY